jgi:hypothetical protein
MKSNEIYQIFECDSKLINVFRVLEKCTGQLLEKFNSRSLYMLLNSLLKIFINRDNVLLENPLENSLIKYTLSEIFALINSYNMRMSPNFGSQPEILIE